MGVFQDELEPTLMEIGMSVEPEDSDTSPENRANSDWDLAERSRITQIAAGSYHSLALSGRYPRHSGTPTTRVHEILCVEFCVVPRAG